jgi:hypothetical protein
VTRDSRRELEELRLFGPVEEEDPGGCGLLSEGETGCVTRQPQYGEGKRFQTMKIVE